MVFCDCFQGTTSANHTAAANAHPEILLPFSLLSPYKSHTNNGKDTKKVTKMQIIKEILLSLHLNLPDSRSSNGNYVACSRSRTVPLPEAFKAKGSGIYSYWFLRRYISATTMRALNRSILCAGSSPRVINLLCCRHQFQSVITTLPTFILRYYILFLFLLHTKVTQTTAKIQKK